MAGETWTEIKLSEVMDVKHGFAFPGENIGEDPSGDVLLTPGNFAVGGGFKGDKLKYFQGEVPEEYVLHENDLIVTMTDLSKAGDTLGYPALVPKPGHFRYLHNQRLGKVVFRDGAKVDKRFISYLLRTPEYRHEILASATGTTVKHTSPSRILAFKTLIPPLAEQRAIAHILGTLDDKIELNRRMNETLEAMARALFKSWFVDFDPVRAKAEGRDTGLPKAIADLFPSSFEESALKSIPKGWRCSVLRDVTAKIGSGATPTGGASVYVDEGVTLIRSQNVYDSLFIWDGLAHITDAAADALQGVIVQREDVLLNITGASILRTCLVDPDVLPARVNQHVCIIRPQPGIPVRYIHFHLLQPSAKGYLMGMDAGASRQAVTKGHIESVPLVIPEKAVLDMFAKLVDPFFAATRNNISQSRCLSLIRDTLLPKLISGELQVKDGERIMAEVTNG
jgi:type I restriction enzyme S subunit